MKKPDASNFQTILLIDTTSRDQVSLALLRNQQTTQLIAPSRAQALMELIEQILQQAKLGLEEVEAIAVCHRPGSLTGTRMGVTAANTLGWLSDRPVIEIASDSFEQALDQLRSQKLPTTATARVLDEVVY